MLQQDTNGWREYKRLVLHEFKQIHKVLNDLSESREEDTQKLRNEFQKALDKTEKRICSKLEKLEDNLTTNYNKLETDVSSNKLSINTLQVKAGGWGVVGGAGITLLVKLIELIGTLLGG